VSCYRGDFHHVQSLLEEPRGCFMSQIVEPETDNPGPLAGSLEGLRDRIRTETENIPAKTPRRAMQGVYAGVQAFRTAGLREGGSQPDSLREGG
jgi:hypothetical protein